MRHDSRSCPEQRWTYPARLTVPVVSMEETESEEDTESEGRKEAVPVWGQGCGEQPRDGVDLPW